MVSNILALFIMTWKYYFYSMLWESNNECWMSNVFCFIYQKHTNVFLIGKYICMYVRKVPLVNTIHWKHTCENIKDANYSNYNPTLELGP